MDYRKILQSKEEITQGRRIELTCNLWYNFTVYGKLPLQHFTAVRRAAEAAKGEYYENETAERSAHYR